MPSWPQARQRNLAITVLPLAREFAEETGYLPDGDFLPLGEALQSGGKLIKAWAIEGDWDPALIQSNTFEIEWPPRSGRRRTFPEIDRAAWFGIADARRKVLKGLIVFVDRLFESAMAVLGTLNSPVRMPANMAFGLPV
jgi:predicted NUDIX family NTP pyrophosphohydrolase